MRTFCLTYVLTLFLDVGTMCKWTVLPTFRSSMSFSRWGSVMSVRSAFWYGAHPANFIFSFFKLKIYRILNHFLFFIF